MYWKMVFQASLFGQKMSKSGSIFYFLMKQWRLRKPLHCVWRPGRVTTPSGEGRPGRQVRCKGFLNLHCFIRKSKIKTDFDIFWPKSEVWETIFQYITSVYPHYQVILIHELEWIFLSLVIQKLSQNAWISASTPLFYLRLARPQK